MKRALGIAVIAALALLAPRDLFAADAVFDITVKADPTKANGSPWDGIPGLHNSKANLNAAPDIAVCVVRANAKPECVWRPDGRRLFSLCQNSWTCTFSGVALTPLPIGLVFIDIDVRNHDIIDTVILTNNADNTAIAEIAASMRAAMSILTPYRSEDSKEHQVRNVKVLPLVDCAGDKPCRLTQSEFRLQPRK
jgi:hypothetical protein